MLKLRDILRFAIEVQEISLDKDLGDIEIFRFRRY